MHGGGIHGEHDVEIGHEGHLVGEGQDSNHDMASVAAIGKVRRTTFLLVASAEEEDADIGLLQYDVEHLGHAVGGVHLAAVLCEGGDTYPTLIALRLVGED